MAFGETLKNARMQKGLSPSAVAEATHMMVQVVEDLEREDFRRIAAPIYGRGFVKLYAELLELDPVPLVRDFMDLYAGARTPAVRVKAVEEPPSAALAEPAARLSTALPPQRQPVQARPAVRPLNMPLPAAVSSADGPSAVKVEEVAQKPSPSAASPAAAQAPVTVEAAAAALVVEPEDVGAVSDEPDLFNPQPLRRKPVAEPERKPDDAREGSEKPARAARKPGQPIFKIGGRLEATHEPEVRDEAAHARRMARMQKFAEGFNALWRGVERRLTPALSYKRYVALGCAGVAAAVCMGIGIHMLFKLTGGSNVKETPEALVEKLAPPPDMYVD